MFYLVCRGFCTDSVGFFMICWDLVQDTVQLFRIFSESCTRIFQDLRILLDILGFSQNPVRYFQDFFQDPARIFRMLQVFRILSGSCRIFQDPVGFLGSCENSVGFLESCENSVGFLGSSQDHVRFFRVLSRSCRNFSGSCVGSCIGSCTGSCT